MRRIHIGKLVALIFGIILGLVFMVGMFYFMNSAVNQSIKSPTYDVYEGTVLFSNESNYNAFLQAIQAKDIKIINYKETSQLPKIVEFKIETGGQPFPYGQGRDSWGEVATNTIAVFLCFIIGGGIVGCLISYGATDLIKNRKASH